MITIPMEVNTDTIEVSMSVASDTETIGMTLGAEYVVSKAIPYEGSYEFTPSEQAQTIEIADKKALHDILINPIPSNYGLITWDGTKLTVS